MAIAVQCKLSSCVCASGDSTRLAAAAAAAREDRLGEAETENDYGQEIGLSQMQEEEYRGINERINSSL